MENTNNNKNTKTFNPELRAGALWTKTLSDGEKFTSGSIEIRGETIRFYLKKNKFKETSDNPKEPDYKLYFFEDSIPPKTPAKSTPAPKNKEKVKEAVTTDNTDF